MNLARSKRVWPEFELPAHRGLMTVCDVLAAPAGPLRDEAIYQWCASVWEAFRGSREAVEVLLRETGIGKSQVRVN